MFPDQAANPFSQMLFPIVVMLGFFYFIVLKPEQRKSKERKEMLSNVKKNDEIVTTGGIHGTVVNVKTDTVIIRVDDNAKIEIDKEAVATIKK